VTLTLEDREAIEELEVLYLVTMDLDLEVATMEELEVATMQELEVATMQELEVATMEELEVARMDLVATMDLMEVHMADFLRKGARTQ